MQPVTEADVRAAAQVLHALPPGLRASRMRRLIAMAEAAASHVRLTGRRHPFWGAGSLREAALGLPCARPARDSDPDWCDCTVSVWLALIGCRAAENPLASLQR